MHSKFRRLAASLLILAPLLSVFFIPKLWTEPAEVHPLGLVIRPHLLVSLISQLNAQSEPVPLPFCQGNSKFDGEFFASISPPAWSFAPDNQILIQLQVQNFLMRGKLNFVGCKSGTLTPEETALDQWLDFKIDIKKMNLDLWFDAVNISGHITSSTLAEIANAMTIELPAAPHYAQFLNQSSNKLAIIQAAADFGMTYLTNILRAQLRGQGSAPEVGSQQRVFTQWVDEVMKDSPIWKSGEIFQRGALKLEIDGNPSQGHLAFAFSRFSDSAIFSEPSGLELFVNAQFFSASDIESLTGNKIGPASRTKALSELTSVLSAQRQPLGNDFIRPVVAPAEHDLSLIIPNSLINAALDTIYRGGLLSFKASLNLSQQTNGIIANGAPDVFTVITINSPTPPQILFQANRFQFKIKDYVLNIFTLIEDHYIRSTRISMEATAGASLKVNPDTKTINLVLDPSQFDVQVRDLKNRLNADDLDILRKLASGLWKHFLQTNSEWVIFPTLFEPKGFSPSERYRWHFVPADLRVMGSNIVLDLDLKRETAS